jgi:hypothetical protein
MAEQPDGCYPRVNGGMMQRDQRFGGKIVSLVGKVIQPNTLQTADGTLVNINLETLHDTTLVMVNPDLCIEIVGMVSDPTTITVRTWLLELISCSSFGEDSCFSRLTDPYIFSLTSFFIFGFSRPESLNALL